MRLIGVAVAACGLWLSIIAQAVAEDLTIVSEVKVSTRYLVGPKNATLTLWMTAGKVRQSDGYRGWIYDVATGMRIDIDHQTRQYWQGTEAERARVAAMKFAPTGPPRHGEITPVRREELIRELRKQQKALELMGRADPMRLRAIYAPTVERAAGDKAIAGYDCEHHRILVTRMAEDGSKKAEVWQELWLAPKIEAPVPFEVLKLAPFLPGVHAAKGFPLAAISPSEGGSFHFSVVAVEIRTGPIDASLFLVPAGYTRVDSPIGVVGSYSSDLR